MLTTEIYLKEERKREEKEVEEGGGRREREREEGEGEGGRKEGPCRAAQAISTLERKLNHPVVPPSFLSPARNQPCLTRAAVSAWAPGGQGWKAEPQPTVM